MRGLSHGLKRLQADSLGHIRWAHGLSGPLEVVIPNQSQVEGFRINKLSLSPGQKNAYFPLYHDAYIPDWTKLCQHLPWNAFLAVTDDHPLPEMIRELSSVKALAYPPHDLLDQDQIHLRVFDGETG